MRKTLLTLVLLTWAATAAAAQSYKPAIEYQSLMNLRFYEANGGFLVEDLQLVFPPANVGNAKFVITDETGAVVDQLPLRYEKMEFPAFGRFRPESGKEVWRFNAIPGTGEQGNSPWAGNRVEAPD